MNQSNTGKVYCTYMYTHSTYFSTYIQHCMCTQSPTFHLFRLDFTLSADEEINCVLLDLHIYRYTHRWQKQKLSYILVALYPGIVLLCGCRHLDTSLLDVDVQPTYVRVTVKRKVRYCLFAETCSYTDNYLFGYICTCVHKLILCLSFLFPSALTLTQICVMGCRFGDC